MVVAGTPAEEPEPAVGNLPKNSIHPLIFETDQLNYPLPGMSDVMPYRSTVFSSMNRQQLADYRSAWKKHVAAVVQQFQPDLIHSHHVWLLSSMLKDIVPNLPVVTSCHATGIRQMTLCPHLAAEVQQGCAQNDGFFVLHHGHADELEKQLGVSPEQIHIVGAGYNESVFNLQGRSGGTDAKPTIVYAGKYSNAKGLPSLLDAIEILRTSFPNVELHVAGSGDSDEANQLRVRMQQMAPTVVLHGQLSQPELAELLKRSSLFVLPSFYEGLPLVVVEAMACGCRVVCTDLFGVRNQIAPLAGELLSTVALPDMESIDQPVDSQLPDFARRLAAAMEQQLRLVVGEQKTDVLDRFTWASVFDKVEMVWKSFVS